jgi:hypothetical protein
MDSHENPIAKGKIRSLPLDLWPEADSNAWISACRPAARLKRGGAAGHLKPVTRDDLARRYGYFLDFLSRRGLLEVDTSAAATLVTLDNVETYIAELKERVGSVTVYGSIYKLRRAAETPGSASSRRTWHWSCGLARSSIAWSWPKFWSKPR